MNKLAVALCALVVFSVVEAVAGDKPLIKQKSYALPRTPINFTIDPAGAHGIVSKAGPRPVAFNPSVAFSWQLGKRWQLDLPEVRSTGGSDGAIGFEISRPW